MAKYGLHALEPRELVHVDTPLDLGVCLAEVRVQPGEETGPVNALFLRILPIFKQSDVVIDLLKQSFEIFGSLNLGFFCLALLAQIVNRLEDARQKASVEVALRDLEVLESRVCLLAVPAEAARQLHRATYLSEN